MRLGMYVEVQSMNRAIDLLILQHTLRPVSERQDRKTIAADGNRSRQIIQLIIVDAFRRYIPFDPRIKDTDPVDAQQDTQAGLLHRMIHVGERIHTGKRIVIHLAVHAIHHSGSPTGSRYLARIQHIQ